MRDPSPPPMAYLPAGRFRMGADNFYPEERPARHLEQPSFWIDKSPVTNEEFEFFTQETGHVTRAEREGALVFHATDGPVPLNTPTAWWRFIEGANWRQPKGPDSTIIHIPTHPVVHISLDDAKAFAVWCNKRLPTEQEWEYAARGGRDGADYAWGNDPQPNGVHMANTWQGAFPWHDSAEDGFAGTSPVRSFPPNGYGLYDMIGNVWEWTTSFFDPTSLDQHAPNCCSGALIPPAQTAYTVKGGSHLCAPDYCLRFRPAARQPQRAPTATSHLGFRCIKDA